MFFGLLFCSNSSTYWKRAQSLSLSPCPMGQAWGGEFIPPKYLFVSKLSLLIREPSSPGFFVALIQHNEDYLLSAHCSPRDLLTAELPSKLVQTDVFSWKRSQAEGQFSGCRWSVGVPPFIVKFNRQLSNTGCCLSGPRRWAAGVGRVSCFNRSVTREPFQKSPKTGAVDVPCYFFWFSYF